MKNTLNKIESNQNTNSNTNPNSNPNNPTASSSDNFSNKSPTTTNSSTKPQNTNISPIPTPIDYFNAKLDTCNKQTCIPLYGFCSSSTNCTCLHGYANAPNVNNKNSNKKACDYNQKKQVTAFLLEFFLNSGYGHFYIGKWWLGLVKLIIVFIIPTTLCFLMCCLDFFKNTLFYVLSIGFIVLSSVWWLVDIILFGLNNYKDSNGVPLETW